MFKVLFKVKKHGVYADCFLFADNVVIGDNHVIVSKSTNCPSFRKTIIWNIPKENFIYSKYMKEGDN